MDKFRVQIEAIKKYHFWILFGLILLISVAIWSIASADSSASYEKDKKRLKDVEGKLTTISNDTKHVNAAWITELQECVGKVSKKNPNSLSNQVFLAWKTLYYAMRRENELPDIYNAKKGNEGDRQLQDAFKRKFDELWRPMEEIAALPTDQGFIDDQRDHYQNHIKAFFPTLLDIIEFRHPDTSEPTPAERAAAAASRRPAAAGEEQKKTVGIVDWYDSTKFTGRFDVWKGSPTTLQIMVAQEDLWVYEAMLKVIRNTNSMGSAADDLKSTYVSPGTHKAARVKRIQSMEICQDALVNWLKADQSIIHLGDSAAAAAAAPGPAKADIRPQGFSAGNGQSSGVSPLANRYVDENGKPLEDPMKQPYAEFRMMPIFMRVVIEQSAIPRLLASCANSSMRIDVTAVRMLGDAAQESPPPPAFEPSGPDAGGVPPGGPGGVAPPTGRPMPMAPMPMGGMRTGGGMAMGPRSGVGMSTADLATDEDDVVNPTFPPVIVEIQGIVYIYNKPKFSQLGKGAAGGAAAEVPPAGGTDADDANADATADASAATSVAPPADTSKAPPAGTGTAPAGSPPGNTAPPNATPTNATPSTATPTNSTPAGPVPTSAPPAAVNKPIVPPKN